MRKLICLGFLICVLAPTTGWSQATDVLRTVANIFIEDGKVQHTGVLADSSSDIFIELTKDSFVGSEVDQREFNGELLAPQITGTLARAPRARMREIVSFDFFTDRADTAIFVDRYAMMHERTRLREQILSGTDFQRSSGAQVLTRLYRDQNIGQAALWRYDNTEEKWHRLGGTTGSSSEPDVDVFSAVIFQTGSYTIWDEDPAPEFSPLTDPTEVELAEASPFPSVEPSGEDTFFESEAIDGEETPFTTNEDDLFNQPVPASPSSPAIEEPPGLIPAVGLSGPTIDAIAEDTTPANQFSDEFLQTIEDARPSAPLEEVDTSDLDVPVGATLPSTGALDEPINWVNYFVFLLLLGVIGGSVWVIKRKPY